MPPLSFTTPLEAVEAPFDVKFERGFVSAKLARELVGTPVWQTTHSQSVLVNADSGSEGGGRRLNDCGESHDSVRQERVYD